MSCLLVPFVLTYRCLDRLKRRLERMKSEDVDNHKEMEAVIRDFDNHVETGFQLATYQGPLCAEPVEGMAFFVESVEIDRASLEKEIGKLPWFPFPTHPLLGCLVFSSVCLCGFTDLDLSIERAKSNGTSDWLGDISCQRCLSEWAVGLVSETYARHVYMRHPGLK